MIVVFQLESSNPKTALVTMPPSRASLDPRDMKAAYVVSDENGYYDSQNIVSLGGGELSGVLHHSRNHEGGKGGERRL